MAIIVHPRVLDIKYSNSKVKKMVMIHPVLKPAISLKPRLTFFPCLIKESIMEQFNAYGVTPFSGLDCRIPFVNLLCF